MPKAYSYKRFSSEKQARGDSLRRQRELADDPRIPLDRNELKALINDPIEFTGAAQEQVSRVVKRIEAITTKHADAAKYQPGSIR